MLTLLLLATVCSEPFATVHLAVSELASSSAQAPPS